MSQYDSLLSDQLDQFDAALDAGMHSPVLEKLAKYYKNRFERRSEQIEHYSRIAV